MKKTHVFENLRIYRQKSFLFSTHIFLFYSDFPCPLAVLVTKRGWCLLCKELRRQYFSFSKADLHYFQTMKKKQKHKDNVGIKKLQLFTVDRTVFSRYFFINSLALYNLMKLTTIGTRREAQVSGWYISIAIQSNHLY